MKWYIEFEEVRVEVNDGELRIDCVPIAESLLPLEELVYLILLSC